MNRRAFTALASASAAAAATSSVLAAAPGGKKKAAIIGHTGRGDYGHGMELVFQHRDDIDLVALADPDEKGREAAMKKSGAPRGYADYREMLEKEKPFIVSIGPRWTDQHLAMTAAALEAGAHVYTEKPFVRNAADGDAILALAARKNLKIAVAHQMRAWPGILALQQAVASGSLIGELCEMRGIGKQDARAGAEDMIVLGCHLYNLMQFFAGDPQWCFASIETKDGRPITAADKRGALKENLGGMAGDRIQATFGFARSVIGTFTSRAELQAQTGGYGLTLVGSRGAVRILAAIPPRIYVQKRDGTTESWQNWAADPGEQILARHKGESGSVLGNRLTLDDLLAAIEQGREPHSSGANATKANEMVQAAFHSALTQSRLALPLEKRSHPFGD